MKPLQLFQVADVDEIKPGERKIVDTEAGAVIVANVDGNFFAVNAKCPHLGNNYVLRSYNSIKLYQ